jgi:DNA-binding transcriptional LysR family regulator
VTTVQLRALIAVVEAGSYSMAARRLSLSQPSVYRVAREFERLSGCALFRPLPQGLEATPIARALARAASLAFVEIRQGLDELRERRGLIDGRVLVGSLPLARTYLLPTAVNQLLSRYPDIKLRIVDGAYGELLHGLRHGQLDCIIGALRLPPPSLDIVQESLFSDPLSIIVRPRHPILQGAPPDATSLARFDWVVPREGTPARSHFAAFFETAGVPVPTRVIECSSLVATRGLLIQSDRLALLSKAQVRYEVAANLLAVLPAPLPGTNRPIGITTRRDWQATKTQAAFLAILRRVITDEQLDQSG